jgi:predicted ABC-type sugar transport system permease subunit
LKRNAAVKTTAMRYRRNVELDPSQVEDRRGQGPMLGLPGGGLTVGGGGLGLVGVLIYLAIAVLGGGNGGALGGLDGALLAGYFRGASVDLGNDYLLASIAVVVIGGTSVAGGKANVPGVWGAGLFLVLLLTMLNTFGVSAGVRLVLTGLIIVGVITAAGGEKAVR